MSACGWWDAVRLLLARRTACERAPRAETDHRRLWVRVVHVYDGDTVTVALFHDGRLRRRRCRLVGIDAPEMRGPDRERAVASRDFLARHLPRRVVRVECRGLDKYGRLLIVFPGPGSEGTMAQFMIEHGHAVPYDGRTKATPVASHV